MMDLLRTVLTSGSLSIATVGKVSGNCRNDLSTGSRSGRESNSPLPVQSKKDKGQERRDEETCPPPLANEDRRSQ